MIVDQAVYRDGKRQPCADLSDELSRLADVPDGFLWIGLKDPTDDEFDLVKDELGLHPLAVEDAVKGNQRTKMEVYDGSLFVVLKPLRYFEETSQVETGEVMLFVGKHFVVTVRRGEASPLSEVRRRLEANSEHLSYGPAAVLHAVMDDVVDQYGAIDQEIAKDLEQMEESVFAGNVEVEEAALGDGRPQGGPARRRGGEDARRIYLLKREVLEVRRAVVPLKDAMLRLHAQETPNVPARRPAVLPGRRRPPAAGQRPHRVLRPAAVGHPVRAPDPGLGAAERRHAADLGLGGHRRRRDADRRDLRDELPAHARAALDARLPDGARADGRRLARAVPAVQEVRLALGSARSGPAQNRRAMATETGAVSTKPNCAYRCRASPSATSDT